MCYQQNDKRYKERDMIKNNDVANPIIIVVLMITVLSALDRYWMSVYGVGCKEEEGEGHVRTQD